MVLRISQKVIDGFQVFEPIYVEGDFGPEKKWLRWLGGLLVERRCRTSVS